LPFQFGFMSHVKKVPRLFSFVVGIFQFGEVKDILCDFQSRNVVLNIEMISNLNETQASEVGGRGVQLLKPNCCSRRLISTKQKTCS